MTSRSRDNLKPWQSGQSGNPTGRPRGARSKLTEAFIGDVLAIWERRGPAILEKCATRDPIGFVNVVAGLMPKKAQLDVELPSVEDLIASYRRRHP